MAISFTPKDINDSVIFGALVIGGADAGMGLVGPMPKYSISRQNTILSDGSYANTKYTINITGTAIIRSSDDQDITILGERQSSLQGEILNLIHFAKHPNIISGILDIISHGGGVNPIRFEDAKLISVDIPDQSDETAGVQNTQYSFVFEAYTITQVSGNSGGVPQTEPTFWVTDVKDSWEFQQSDSVTYEINDLSTAINTYVVTRNLSATGIRKPGAGFDGQSPIQSAMKWVESKLTSAIPPDFFFPTDAFNIYEFDDDNKFKVNSPRNFANFSGHLNINHVRSISSDVLTGTYSVTDTWTLNKGSLSNLDISVEIESSQDKEFNTVSVKIDIQGVDTTDFSSITQNKYDNALASFNILKPQVYTIALSAYNDAGLNGNLRNVKTSESTSTNKSAGSISYSVTMDDLQTIIVGALTESINIEDDNEDGLNQIIAKIDIIGKPDGPVIQDMSTTTIKSRSISIDAIMDRDHRQNKPSSQALSLANSYKPTQSSFRQSKRESWNPRNGKYTLSINWEYT